MRGHRRANLGRASHRLKAGATAAGRRGLVILMVLMVIALGALVGTAVLYFASAQRAAMAAMARRTQARALAWSGVQAVTGELWKQRNELLRGGRPKLEEERVVYEDHATTTTTGDRGVYRLRPAAGSLMTAEAGRLDANSAPADILVKAGISAETAAEIAVGRRARAFTSVAEVLALPTWGLRAAGDEVAAPSSLLTVFSFDPQVQAGASDGGKYTGRPRIDVAAEWTPESAAALEEDLGPELAAKVRSAVGTREKPREGDKPAAAAAPPASLGELYDRLVAAGLDAKTAARVMDVCTVGGQPFRTGLVSVLEASRGVLAAVPGLTADAAAKIVGARDSLSDDERATLAWLIDRSMLTPEQFRAAREFLTPRCLQWRVVVEGGVVTRVASEQANSDRAALRDRVVLEAVIDVSGSEPRVAYLRDITMLEAAEWLDARAAVLHDPPRADPVSDAAPAPAPASETARDVSPSAQPAPNVQVEQPVRRGPASGGRVGRWTTGGGG